MRRLSLSIILTMLVLGFNTMALPEEIQYRGAINYYNIYVNQFFYLDAEGNLTLGISFPECEWRFYIDPYGIIFLGFDNDFLINKSFKWYRIEGENFVQSSQPLLVGHNCTSPVVWTPTPFSPFRVIIGSYPTRVWDLDPKTLRAKVVSEFSAPEWGGDEAIFVKDLNFIFLNYHDFKILRAQYNDDTGVISGPVTVFPTTRRGNIDMKGTSDGRIIFRLGDTRFLSVFYVEDDGTLTMVQDYNLHNFGIANAQEMCVSPDDKYLFLIACDSHNVNSFQITSSGALIPIYQSPLHQFNLAQAMALSQDGKFLVVAHHYYGGYPAAILSAFSVNEDGSLTYLSGQDVPLRDTVGELQFFPPQCWPTAANHWTQYY